MRPKYQQLKLVNEINVVPYIDVMLVLLVIFMITAPLLAQGVKVDLPDAKAEVLPPSQKEPFIVSVDKGGRFYFNATKSPSQPLDDDQLGVEVAAHIQLEPNRSVLVNGDKGVDYGRVVTAMAIIQSAGAKSVGLMTSSQNEG